MSKEVLKDVRDQSKHCWDEICKLRRQMELLYQDGVKLSDPRMLDLSRKATEYGQLLVALDTGYEEILLLETPEAPIVEE